MGSDGRALVVQADALHLPLPDASVDLCVTSPPYFALRAYGAGPGEIGSEATPAEFLAALWAVMAEVKRVLKPSGSAFVNLGDKYCSGTSSPYPPSARPEARTGTYATGGKGLAVGERIDADRAGVREKSLLGLPWAFALGCTGMLAALGGPDPGLDLILRAPIVLHKRNSLPESVRDRVRTSDQELLFHFVLQPRYYAAVDELREPYEIGNGGRQRAALRGTFDYADSITKTDHTPGQPPQAGWKTSDYHPLGKLPGSVWPMTSEPLRLPPWLGVQHYAAFSSELPRRCILGWSPPGICVACGEGRWPVVDRRIVQTQNWSEDARRKQQEGREQGKQRLSGDFTMIGSTEATILGYACSCTPFTDHAGTGEPSGRHGRVGNVAEIGGYPNTGAGWTPSASGHGGVGDRPKVGPWREYHLTGWQAPPTRPAVVLDPFGGTGTVGLVARALGRDAIIGDLSHPYCRVARYRIFDSGDAGKAISRTWRERQGELL